MGARVSVQFKSKTTCPFTQKKREEKSLVLFNHWGGMEFVKETIEYAKKLVESKKGKESTPLDRLEPGTVLVDFIRHITKELDTVESSLYLEKSEKDGDNSDYGHHIILLEK
jgi:hypothetical protein